MIREAISDVVQRKNLTETEMEKVMDEIMSGQATPAQIGSFITGLRMKGETVEEIAGAARTMRAKASNICVTNRNDEIVLDIVGTGGDGAKTFNVSTTSAFVAAGAGIKVAKHGNRAVSSQCGAADVLEGLGVKLDLSPADVEACIKEIGIGFLFAPMFHGAMKHAAGPRKDMGIRSVFNLLGPLTNPASATVLLLGVYNPGLTEPIARVLNRLGTKEAFVVCGDGPEGILDEVSICGPTKVSQLKDKEVNTYHISPEDFGISRAALSDIVGGDTTENAAITRTILEGEKGPKTDMVILNAAAALTAAGLSADIKEGVSLARHTLDSGKAVEKLDKLIKYTQKFA